MSTASSKVGKLTQFVPERKKNTHLFNTSLKIHSDIDYIRENKVTYQTNEYSTAFLLYLETNVRNLDLVTLTVSILSKIQHGNGDILRGRAAYFSNLNSLLP